MIKYTNARPFKAFSYLDKDGKMLRIDFDRPVMLYEIRVGNQIVAIEASDPIHGHIPTLTVAIIANEERSRFTFNSPVKAAAGMVLMVMTDRECKAAYVMEDGTIDSQYEQKG